MKQSRFVSDYVVPLWEPPSVAVDGGALYPVRNIYCVGRNYAEHAREMGTDPEREPKPKRNGPLYAGRTAGPDC